jgi:hypothetical protein
MKLKKLAFVMGLLLASSALAADSGGNLVYIDQTNADNSSVSITQTGSNNQVGDLTLTSPFLIDGNSMFLTINQDGMSNSILGNFIGGDSTMNILQSGNSNTTNFNMGNFGTNSGTLNLSVTGSNNSTALNIGTTNNSSNYKYDLTINGSNLGGNGNSVTSNINSTYTNNTILLTGSSNTLTTTQIGAGGTSLVDGHNIKANVIGSNNDMTILQNGTTNPNNVTVNVTGSNTTTAITQH